MLVADILGNFVDLVETRRRRKTALSTEGYDRCSWMSQVLELYLFV